MFITNLQDTVCRQTQLEQYYAKDVLRDKHFVCRCFDKCRASHAGTYYEGQVHYVGSNYDILVGPQPLRVVVVGQEYGHGPALVDSLMRAKMFQDSAHKSRGFLDRNPHMRGTTTALRILFGIEPGEDKAGEWLETSTGRIHLFDAFSLVNFLMCSATDGSSKGKATSTMLSNCSKHFVKVLEILQPTVLVCQGKGFFTYLAESLGVSKQQKEMLFHYRFNGVDGVGVCLNHPSTPRWDSGWAQLTQPYLTSRVLPLLNDVRCELGLDQVIWNL
uniref:Uracil-DNA glycosylase-like domain-containing protein n=1 Tax=Chlorobium chlorochromatii (strain CaD3) TaxID=340177 RepID=Q3ASQ0_CHLCH